jgi:hypothetical protein
LCPQIVPQRPAQDKEIIYAVFAGSAIREGFGFQMLKMEAYQEAEANGMNA